MSNEEKQSIISIISVIVVYILYGLFVFRKYQSGGFDPSEDLRQWGLIILILIPIQIIINIIISILFTMAHAIVTGEDDESSLTDERDKIITLKANSTAYVVVGVGFMISIITIVFGLPPFVMINVVYLSFNLAEIVGSSVKIRFYRRGF